MPPPRHNSYFSMILKKYKGFTLAEVLITLGIIGIVASLTLPSLIDEYRKKQTAIAVKKFYTEFSQVLKLAEIDYGDINEWDFPSGESVEISKKFVDTYIKPYYKGLSELNSGNKEGRWDNIAVSRTAINLVTLDGTILSIKPYRNTLFVLIDVNGLKKPNKMGTDIFYFDTESGKFMPSGWEDNLTREKILSRSNYGCKTTKTETDIGDVRHGCTALLMLDGWEFKKDYPWKFNSKRTW